MKRLAVLLPIALSIAAALAPSASAEGWMRCGNSVTVREISCPAARRFAHEYLRYYRASPIPKKVPGGFTCPGEMLNVGRFEHFSCARIKDGVRQRVRFFFDGRHIGGPRDYWKRCGIRSRIHGSSCAEAREVGIRFLEMHRQKAHVSDDHVGDWYCTIEPRRVNYGPIFCIAAVGYEHQSTFTEWKLLLSFEELGKGRRRGSSGITASAPDKGWSSGGKACLAAGRAKARRERRVDHLRDSLRAARTAAVRGELRNRLREEIEALRQAKRRAAVACGLTVARRSAR